jgi:DNA-binding transcriptional ArsR family regulator
MVDTDADLDSVFHALADPTRRAIVQRLAGGGVLVKDLAEPIAMSKQGVSKHLRVLEEAGLVAKTAEGRSTKVELRAETLKQIEDWVSFYRDFWTDSLAALANVIEANEEKRG